MTIEILFKIKEENTENILSDIRIIKFNINNKFYSQNTIGLQNTIFIPNANKSDIALDCIIAISNEAERLQKIALNILPITCKIKFENGDEIAGSFFISNYSRNHSTGDIPEISFKLKSSGAYECKRNN